MRISHWSSDVCSSDLVPVAADRPLHPGRTAVQDDLLTYVERLRALAGPLVADRTRRVAIGIGAGVHVFDALGCTCDYVGQPVTVRRFEQGKDEDAAIFTTGSRFEQAQDIAALSQDVIV